MIFTTYEWIVIFGIEIIITINLLIGILFGMSPKKKSIKKQVSKEELLSKIEKCGAEIFIINEA